MRSSMLILFMLAPGARAAEVFGTFSDLGSSDAVLASSVGGTGEAGNPWGSAAVVDETQAATDRALASHALIVAGDAHAMIMQYEPMWGPNAVPLNSPATPKLTSASMIAAGLRGYDSADPLVIAQHVRWMRQMSVDAISLDFSNINACTFNGDVAQFCPGGPAQQSIMRQVRANFANIYAEYQRTGVTLKIVPMLDGQEDNLYVPDTDGFTGVEKQLRFVTGLMDQYPAQSLVYQTHPMITVFMGSPARTDLVGKFWSYVTAMRLDQRFTFRFSTGFIDHQPSLWGTSTGLLGLPQVSGNLPYWSIIDRYRPGLWAPSYVMAGERVESFTAAVAFGGTGGWSDPNSGLRNGGKTFQSFLDLATQLKPTFLTIAMFNELGRPDQGDDAEHDMNIEPTDLWGTATLDFVTNSLAAYKRTIGGVVISQASLSSSAGFMAPGYFTAQDRWGYFMANGEGHYCLFPNMTSFTESGGTADQVRVEGTVLPAMSFDGECTVHVRPGFFGVGGKYYWTSGNGTYCALAPSRGPQQGSGDVRMLWDGIPKGNVLTGTCP